MAIQIIIMVVGCVTPVAAVAIRPAPNVGLRVGITVNAIPVVNTSHRPEYGVKLLIAPH